MTLHELCLNALNHEITQALACSKRLEKSNLSDALASLGLLHFFVVSGAHLSVILNFSNIFKVSSAKFWIKNLALLLFVGMCNGSPPILRVFLSYALQTGSKSAYLFIPNIANHFISYSVCISLFSFSKFLIFSTNLSFAFWTMMFMARTHHILNSTLRLYFISIPFFIFVFGVPHYSTLVVAPITAVIVSFILLPASLTAVFYPSAETLTIESWWLFQDFINYVNVFFNFPRKFQCELSFMGSKRFIMFNVVNFIIIYTGSILWRRKSYSFS